MTKNLPLPITGAALGAAALGNLLQSYSEKLRFLCGILSFLLLLLFLVKLVAYTSEVKKELTNPVMASIAATIPMTVILLSSYIRPYYTKTSEVIWILGIVFHIFMIFWFTRKYIFHLNIENIYASCFIVYVGIVVISVTAPVFAQNNFGQIIWRIGMLLWILTLGLVTFRYVKYKEIKKPLQPLFCIYAAPPGLILAGYIQSFEKKSMAVIFMLMMVSVLFYSITFIKAASCLKDGFYPSFAAFTFPFVIQAIGMKMSNTYFITMHIQCPLLREIVLIETLVAFLFVVYVIYGFFKFLIMKKPCK